MANSVVSSQIKMAEKGYLVEYNGTFAIQLQFPANLIVVVGFISVIVLIVVFIEVLEPPTPNIFCSTFIVR